MSVSWWLRQWSLRKQWRRTSRPESLVFVKTFPYQRHRLLPYSTSKNTEIDVRDEYWESVRMVQSDNHNQYVSLEAYGNTNTYVSRLEYNRYTGQIINMETISQHEGHGIMTQMVCFAMADMINANATSQCWTYPIAWDDCCVPFLMRRFNGWLKLHFHPHEANELAYMTQSLNIALSGHPVRG